MFGAGPVTQECGAGVLPIEVTATGATLTGGAPTLGPELDPEPLLEMVGLDAGRPRRARPAGWPAAAWSSPTCRCARTRWPGHGWTRRRPQRYGIEHVSVFSWDAAERKPRTPGSSCPGPGSPEDPATGSAALGLGVWLVASGLLPGEGTSAYAVRQGAGDRPPLRAGLHGHRS